MLLASTLHILAAHFLSNSVAAVKLFNIDHSPYATRVRMLIRKKQLTVDITPPPVPLRTPEFKARFPLGKLPVLEINDSVTIADSWAIMEYLEDVFPERPLRPEDPLARAQMHMLARYADTYLGPAALFPLFARLMVPGGTEGAEDLLDALQVELQRLENLLPVLPELESRSIHLGDIALVTTMAYVIIVAPIFGVAQPLAQTPAVRAWWDWVQTDNDVRATTDEMTTAFQQFMQALQSK